MRINTRIFPNYEGLQGQREIFDKHRGESQGMKMTRLLTEARVWLKGCQQHGGSVIVNCSNNLQVNFQK